MKKFTLLLLFIAVFQITKAQTTLQSGDVAIVQVNYSYNSFDFVCFVDIEAGTKIRFTDYAYSSTLSNLDQTSTSDGIYEFTASTAIAAGTVIQYRINSTVNTSFTTIAGSSLSMRSYKNNYALAGENLIAYQQSGDIKTYLFAMGWMRKDNFATNPSNVNAKVCDIPTGLSKENYTVVQIDSVMKAGQNPQLARDFKYNKYDGFTATAYMLRRYLTSVSNYSTYSGALDNNPVENFVVLAPDNTSPILNSSYPSNNKINVSVNSGIELVFNEKVEVIKQIIVRNTNSQASLIVTKDEMQIQDSILSFSFDGRLNNASNYVIEIAQASISDLNGNTWPAENTNVYFSTSAKRSNISIDFSSSKENLKWTTQSTIDYFGGFYLYGYWSFTIKNLPMRWYINEYVEDANSIPTSSSFGDEMFIGGMNNSRLVIDLGALNNTITNIDSYVYDNNCQIVTSLYGNANIIKSNVVTNSNNSAFTINEQHYVKQFIENDNAVKIDSVVFASPEGRVFRTNIEMIDLAAPIVELGANKVICEGDSVVFDAGYTPGAVYAWNTGAKTQKIIAKTSGNYSVSVKNTLGEVSDNVQLTVLPVVHVNLPDTVNACVGDTITLTAGTNTENTYLWSPTAETSPSIKVTQSGMYHVIVSNGSCLATDSSRVIFKGARLGAFFNQGGMTGYEDVRAELYKKNKVGKIELYRTDNMPQIVILDSLPAGQYILKAHFVNWTFMGENPFLDTYHNGETEWTKATPFSLNCASDTTISFSLANKPYFEFNGTAVISGKVAVVAKPLQSRIKAIANGANDCDTKVLLYDGSGNLIATTCPDSQGNYSFTNLPAGNYSIGIERTGYEVEEVFTTQLTAGQTISNADFTVNENSQTVVRGLSTALNGIYESDLNFTVSPNPMYGKGVLVIDAVNQGNAIVSVLDLTGKIMSSNKHYLNQGRNSFEISTNNLQGLYLLKVISTQGSGVKRILIK